MAATKQVGRIDGDLLARVDERAAVLGQTRRVFVERALSASLFASETNERMGHTAAVDDASPPPPTKE